MTEQIEFHVFGGSGSAGVTSSLVSLGRSFTAFIILLPIMYYACENDNKDALVMVKKLGQRAEKQKSRAYFDQIQANETQIILNQ